MSGMPSHREMRSSGSISKAQCEFQASRVSVNPLAVYVYMDINVMAI